MNIKELVNIVNQEMKHIAFNQRKDVYSQFEFDYLHKLEKDYYIIRYGQQDYIFKNKTTKEVESIHITTNKNGNYTELKEAIYKEHKNDLYTHLNFE